MRQCPALVRVTFKDSAPRLQPNLVDRRRPCQHRWAEESYDPGFLDGLKDRRFMKRLWAENFFRRRRHAPGKGRKDRRKKREAAGQPGGVNRATETLSRLQDLAAQVGDLVDPDDDG